MNVFTNTKKSILFFLNMFNFDNKNGDSIGDYVKQEYGINDRKWAYEEIINKARKTL
jgi:hypothetical protein